MLEYNVDTVTTGIGGVMRPKFSPDDVLARYGEEVRDLFLSKRAKLKASKKDKPHLTNGSTTLDYHALNAALKELGKFPQGIAVESVRLQPKLPEVPQANPSRKRSSLYRSSNY